MLGRAKLHSCPLEPRPLPSLPTYRTAPSPVSFCCSHTPRPLSSLLQSSHLHPFDAWLVSFRIQYTHFTTQSTRKKTQPTPQSSHLHPLMMPGLCLSGYNIYISQHKAQEKRHNPHHNHLIFTLL